MIWKIAAHWNYFMKKCRQDKINAYAAQSAFFIIVSIIPFLMVFSSLLQYTSVTESMLLELMRRIIPEYLAPFFISLVDEVYNRSMGIISATALVAVWSAAKGVQYLADGFNSVHDLEETRNWFVLRFWAILYTLVFLAAIILTLSVIVFGNSLRLLAAQYLPILSKLAGILSHLKGLWMLAVLILFFDIIFTTLPNRKLTLKSQLPGALFLQHRLVSVLQRRFHLCRLFQWFFNVRQSDDDRTRDALVLFLHLYYDDRCGDQCCIRRSFQRRQESATDRKKYLMFLICCARIRFRLKNSRMLWQTAAEKGRECVGSSP